MRVDVARQPAPDAAHRARRARGQAERAQRLRAARRRVDERFDPRKALAATAPLPGDRARPPRPRRPRHRQLPHGHRQPADRRSALYGAPDGIPYAQLFFDSTPAAPRGAPSASSPRLGDDSLDLPVARRRRRARSCACCATTATSSRAATALQTARNSAEEVLHPPGETEAFGDPDALADAYDDGEIVAAARAPTCAATASRVDPQHGRAGRARRRAAARATAGCAARRWPTLAYIGTQVRRMLGAARAAARDEHGARRRLPAGARPRATSRRPGATSLHTTGYAFDIGRTLREPRAGARLPVRARPPDRAEPDRLGARARARSTSPSRATPSGCRRRSGSAAASPRSSSARSTTLSTVKPSFSRTSGPGAEAPKRSSETDASTHWLQPIATPASTETFGTPAGSTDAR